MSPVGLTLPCNTDLRGFTSDYTWLFDSVTISELLFFLVLLDSVIITKLPVFPEFDLCNDIHHAFLIFVLFFVLFKISF